MTSFDVDPTFDFEVADAQIGFICRPEDVIVRRSDGSSLIRRRDTVAIPRRADNFPLIRRRDVIPVEKRADIMPLVKVAA